MTLTHCSQEWCKCSQVDLMNPQSKFCNRYKLEQLERLRSEIPLTAPWLPYISNFEILQETLHVTHPLKLLDKMYKYEMDPTRTVGTTERIRDAGRTDGQSETNIPPNNFVVWTVEGIITMTIYSSYITNFANWWLGAVSDWLSLMPFLGHQTSRSM